MCDCRLTTTVLLAAALFAGCSDESARRDAARPIDLRDLPGFYSGQYPCSDCPGIDTRLWLRADGTYFLRQRYLSEISAASAPYYNLGRWRWDAEAGLLVLLAPGPGRRFAFEEPAHLALQTESPLEHRLERAPAVPPFTDSLQLEGEYSLQGKQALFRECRTGLRFAIAPGGDHRRLREHYRSLTPRGEPAVASVIARMQLAEQDDGHVLQVERLLTVKPAAHCPP